MLRPQRFAHEVDPGPVQIQARNVAFETAGKPKDWIPGHPVSSHLVNLLNIMLPAGERWFVEVFNEALPLIKDPKLAEDVRADAAGAGALRRLAELTRCRQHLSSAAEVQRAHRGPSSVLIALVKREAQFYDGDNGENVRIEPVPAQYKAAVEEYRLKLVEALVGLGLATSKVGGYAPPLPKPFTGELARFAP